MWLTLLLLVTFGIAVASSLMGKTFLNRMVSPDSIAQRRGQIVPPSTPTPRSSTFDVIVDTGTDPNERNWNTLVDGAQQA